MRITSFTGSEVVNAFLPATDKTGASPCHGFIAYDEKAEVRINVGTLVAGGFEGLYGYTVTGGTSGATGVLRQFENTAGVTFIGLSNVVGVFQNAELLAANGLTRATSTSAPLDITDTRRSLGAGPCTLLHSGDPNGVLEAPRGSIAYDTTGAAGPYRNTTGSTVWVAV